MKLISRYQLGTNKGGIRVRTPQEIAVEERHKWWEEGKHKNNIWRYFAQSLATADPAAAPAYYTVDENRKDARRLNEEMSPEDYEEAGKIGAGMAAGTTALGLGFTFAPMATATSLGLGYGVDKGTQLISGNRYRGWGNMLAQNIGGPEWAWSLSNPGYFAGPLGFKLLSGSNFGRELRNFIKNWRPSVPNDANRYYRIVGETGDPIGDAIESGVIRAGGANPKLQVPLAEDEMVDMSTALLKPHDYPMFAKGRPWTGSTARVDEGKPYIIRSKQDTGPIVWEESNKNFKHKGHAGIFRPNYFGDLNASPTTYFEWWEPKKLGYLRHEFPTSSQPKWLGEYPKDNSKFGNFIGEGSEQAVFDNGKDVIKINFERSDNTVKEMLEQANKTITNRNSVSEQIPISLEGFVSEAGSKPKLHAVYRQEKLGSAYDLDEEVYQTLFTDLSQRLRQNGWLMKYSDKYYNPELDKTLLDVTRQNIGVKNGKLYIFDGDVYKK